MLFANAIFQWVPGHLKQLQRLLGTLAPGGVLAVQMPDNLDEPAHVLMREIAQAGPWRETLAETARLRDSLPTPGGYYDALRPLCTRLEIWHTIYNHVLDDAAAIVEWVKGTGLRPFVDPLDPPERKQYLAEYTARIAASYPPQADGKVLLRFPRIFMVAVSKRPRRSRFCSSARGRPAAAASSYAASHDGSFTVVAKQRAVRNRLPLHIGMLCYLQLTIAARS